MAASLTAASAKARWWQVVSPLAADGQPRVNRRHGVRDVAHVGGACAHLGRSVLGGRAAHAAREVLAEAAGQRQVVHHVLVALGTRMLTSTETPLAIAAPRAQRSTIGAPARARPRSSRAPRTRQEARSGMMFTACPPS
jgi:hypothetical protein